MLVVARWIGDFLVTPQTLADCGRWGATELLHESRNMVKFGLLSVILAGAPAARVDAATSADPVASSNESTLLQAPEPTADPEPAITSEPAQQTTVGEPLPSDPAPLPEPPPAQPPKAFSRDTRPMFGVGLALVGVGFVCMGSGLVVAGLADPSAAIEGKAVPIVAAAGASLALGNALWLSAVLIEAKRGAARKRKSQDLVSAWPIASFDRSGGSIGFGLQF